MAVICRFVFAPLPWVQWLSGKSVQLVIGRSRVRFPAGSLWIFLSLSLKLTSSYTWYILHCWQLLVRSLLLDNNAVCSLGNSVDGSGIGGVQSLSLYV